MDAPEDETTEIIEELSNALSSGIAPLDSSSTLACCCQQDDCENYRAWQDAKSSLESKFTLTVGHELLQRFEGLRQQHNTEERDSPTVVEESQVQISELIMEKQNLEKQLDQAFIHTEVIEAALDSLHKELQEAHQTIARLTADNVMYSNMEPRLLEVINERDDLQQEREAASANARQAELNIARFQAKISEFLLHLHAASNKPSFSKAPSRGDCCSRMQNLKFKGSNAKFSLSRATESTELTKSLEYMCTANERLKRHIEEVESLLRDARDEIQVLRREVEEQGADLPTLPIIEYNELQDALNKDEVTIDVGMEYNSEVYEFPQHPQKATLRDIVLKFFFLVGILSYWVFCARAIGHTMLREDDWLRVVKYVLAGTISLVFIGWAVEKQPDGSLYEMILINVTSFIGASFCIFIGGRIVFEIRAVLALSYIDYIIGLVAHMQVWRTI
ncbi:hypothetical protein C8R42DRAFT_725414 [Lentinula raphanica]|nr:hypothetical protein C8R42DRAFT_725414 [Lentinula raphanica]